MPAVTFKTKSVTLRIVEDIIHVPECATFQNFCDDCTAVEECFLETGFATSLAWCGARVKILYPAEQCVADLEFLANEPKQFNTVSDDVAIAVSKSEVCAFEKPSVHQADLTMTDASLFVIAALADSIPVPSIAIL